MNKYPKPDWASHQIIRGDRRKMIEDICKTHGVGHPNKQWMQEHPEENGIHGCCGCCHEVK